MRNESPERQSQSDTVPKMSLVNRWMVLVDVVTSRGRCGPAITLIMDMKAPAPLRVIDRKEHLLTVD